MCAAIRPDMLNVIEDRQLVDLILSGDGEAAEELLLGRCRRTLAWLSHEYGYEDLITELYLHPNEELLAMFALHILPKEKEPEIEEHLKECSACRAEVITSRRLRDLETLDRLPQPTQSQIIALRRHLRKPWHASLRIMANGIIERIDQAAVLKKRYIEKKNEYYTEDAAFCASIDMIRMESFRKPKPLILNDAPGMPRLTFEGRNLIIRFKGQASRVCVRFGSKSIEERVPLSGTLSIDLAETETDAFICADTQEPEPVSQELQASYYRDDFCSYKKADTEIILEITP